MCTPSIYILEDGITLGIRKGGMDWAVSTSGEFANGGVRRCVARAIGDYGYPHPWSYGRTIMEAVDNALDEIKNDERFKKMD